MLQKVFKFSQILKYVDRKWKVAADINGKHLGKFSRAEDRCKLKLMQKS